MCFSAVEQSRFNRQASGPRFSKHSNKQNYNKNKNKQATKQLNKQTTNRTNTKTHHTKTKVTLNPNKNNKHHITLQTAAQALHEQTIARHMRA
jgi:hypothetical protein